MKYNAYFFNAAYKATVLFLLLCLVNVSVVPSTSLKFQLRAQEGAQEDVKSDFVASAKRVKAANQAFEEKNYVLAQKECEASLSLNPNNAVAQELQTRIQSALNDLDESIDQATSLYESQQNGEALATTHKIKENYVNYPPAANALFEQAARVLVADGIDNFARDFVDKAYAKAQEALEFNPNDSSAIQLLNLCEDAFAEPFSQTVAGARVTLKYNDVEFAFRYCPPGSYTMGSPSNEKLRNDNETQRSVKIDKGFWISETETTQAQWNAVGVPQMRHCAYEGDKLPVTNVCWNECDSFVKKLNELKVAPESWNVALPTEEQWEYACRAGTSGIFHWISLEGYAHYVGQSYIYEVGGLEPNSWGVYDMLGNVEEFTSSREKVKSSYKYIYRGGRTHWANCCRPAFRGYLDSSKTENYIGFRIVLIPNQSYRKPSISSISSKTQGNGQSVTPGDDLNNDFLQTEPGSRATLEYNGTEFAFHFCPSGSYLAGSPDAEQGRSRNENQHDVNIDEGFWIGETETTQAQWNSVGVPKQNECQFIGDNLPVEKVSWNECDALVKKLNELGVAPDGWRFALPTEDQWEYACRAGTTGANYGVSVEKSAWTEGNSAGSTHEVGGKERNPWGLYDMIGNVSEWTDSQYGNGDSKVYRGGSWNIAAQRCRPAYRYGSGAKTFGKFLGVRLVLVPDQTK